MEYMNLFIIGIGCCAVILGVVLIIEVRRTNQKLKQQSLYNEQQNRFFAAFEKAVKIIIESKADFYKPASCKECGGTEFALIFERNVWECKKCGQPN